MNYFCCARHLSYCAIICLFHTSKSTTLSLRQNQFIESHHLHILLYQLIHHIKRSNTLNFTKELPTPTTYISLRPIQWNGRFKHSSHLPHHNASIVCCYSLMELPLPTSTNTYFGIIREYNAIYRCPNRTGNVYPCLSLVGGKVASVDDWDFVLREDFACEVLAIAAVAYYVLVDACIFVRGDL